MKIIILGAGQVGGTLAEHLADEQNDITVVDLDSDRLRELQDRLDEAMERLTHRQRTALHLRAVEGMDYATISGVLNCSTTAARMHVLEARRKVLARLKEHIDS